MSTQKEEKVLSVSLRHTLKTIMQKEVEKIPEYLNQVEEPNRKLALLAKFLPYVLPKHGNVSDIDSNEQPELRIWVIEEASSYNERLQGTEESQEG